MGFLPANYQLHTPFHSRLRVSHGTDRQTDRQTMAINALCPTLWVWGTITWNVLWSVLIFANPIKQFSPQLLVVAVVENVRKFSEQCQLLSALTYNNYSQQLKQQWQQNASSKYNWTIVRQSDNVVNTHLFSSHDLDLWTPTCIHTGWVPCVPNLVTYFWLLLIGAGAY